MRYLEKCIFIAVLTVALMQAGPSLPKNCHLVELSSLGIPASGCVHAAKRINDLQFFNGKLYIGYGDAVINTGPTDIIFFDLNEGSFHTEFTVDEEGIYTYKIIDNTLMIPGVDATEEWDFGNIYILSEDGWIKHRTIPHGLHVNDLASYSGDLFASTGTYGTIGDSVEHYFGAIFTSADTGQSWTLAYATTSDDRSIYRITALMTYKNLLYAFPFAYTNMTKAEVPEEFQTGLSEEPYADSTYLIILDDILGVNDVITFNNDRWQYKDIIHEEHLCFVKHPFIFDDHMILPILIGEYVDYLQKNIRFIPHTKQRLCMYDGSDTKEVKLTFDRILDVKNTPEYAYFLIQRDDLYYIVRTDDMKNWVYFVLPPIIDDPRSFEYIDNTFFIGTESGNLFVSQQIAPVKKYQDIEHCVPQIMYAESELPEQNALYWTVVHEQQDSTSHGKLYAQVKYGNIIKLSAENITSFSIISPIFYLDTLHETTVIINDVVAFEGMINEITELVCELQDNEEGSVWHVSVGNQESSGEE